jgi:hypothetical protein
VSGVQGPAGETGASGPQGPAGVTGVSGPQGPAGVTGVSGVQGPAGETGASGVQGPAGVTGVSGVQGPQGPAGAVGGAGNALPLTSNNGITGNFVLYGMSGTTGYLNNINLLTYNESEIFISPSLASDGLSSSIVNIRGTSGNNLSSDGWRFSADNNNATIQELNNNGPTGNVTYLYYENDYKIFTSNTPHIIENHISVFGMYGENGPRAIDVTLPLKRNQPLVILIDNTDTSNPITATLIPTGGTIIGTNPIISSVIIYWSNTNIFVLKYVPN